MTAFGVLPAGPIEAYIDATIDQGAFPDNIVQLIVMRFQGLMVGGQNAGLNVVPRMPAADDPNYTVGVVAALKTPVPDTTEIRGPNSFVGATVNEHLVIVYAFVKDSSRERGASAHAVLAEIVEDIVSADQALNQALASLHSTILSTRKRMGKHYVRQTRYLANEVGDDHVFLSATECIYETEKY